MALAEFSFENVDALGSNESILLNWTGELGVRIYRAMRTSPLPGMKQPARNGAILGMETVLEIAVRGLPAIGYRWKIYRNDKLVQSGKTDKDGVSRSIKIGLPSTIAISPFSICVFEPLPKRRRRAVSEPLLQTPSA